MQPLERLKYYQDGFQHLQLAPPDPILGTALAFKACTNKDKINLGIGAFRDEYSEPYVFNVVRKAESELFKEGNDKEYLPIEGFAPFNDAAQKLVFGSDNKLVQSGCISTVQCLSGTGALRVGFEFLNTHLKGSGEVLVSDPTWGNHVQIIQRSGFKVKYYPYWDESTKGLNFQGLLKAINEAQPKSIILLHVCAHNPTGVDPTPEQWKQIGEALKEKQIFPFFDSAYQGFASGNLKKDAQALEIFQQLDLQFCVSQSFAKNMGMYGERIGALHFVCKSKQVADILLSQMKLIIRPMYSSPPIWGAKLVAKILNNPETNQKWQAELKDVAQQIIDRRNYLKKYLVQYKAQGTWEHITNQIGMFSYTGLNKAQCELLIKKHNIFLVTNGRISMAGVTSRNVKKLAQAIQDVLQETDKAQQAMCNN